MPAKLRPEDGARRHAARFAGVLALIWVAFAVLGAGSLALLLAAATLAFFHCILWVGLGGTRVTKAGLSAARFIGVAIPLAIFFVMMFGVVAGPYLVPVYAMGLAPFLVAETLLGLSIGRVPDSVISTSEQESSQRRPHLP